MNTVKQKLTACADSHHGVEDLEEKVEKGLDPLGRGQMYQAVPIDDTYPEYILNNQDKYSKLIKPWK